MAKRLFFCIFLTWSLILFNAVSAQDAAATSETPAGANKPADAPDNQPQVSDIVPQVLDSGSAGLEQNASYYLGRQNGITASIAEIQARRQLLQKLNGNGSSVQDSVVAQMIIAEKFIAKECAVKPTDSELRDAFKEFTGTTSGNRSLSYTEVLPLLEKQVILSKRENRVKLEEKIRVYREQMQKSMETNTTNPAGTQNVTVKSPDAGMPQMPAMWETAKVQIVADGNACIAYGLRSGKCEVTVDEFNRHALTISFPKTVPLDSVRIRILDKALNVAYYAGKAEETGFVSDPGMQQTIAARMRASSGGGNCAAISDSLLKSLYAQYYDSMFAERERVEVDLLGSTDSLYIDSLLSILSHSQAMDTAKGKKNSKRNRMASFNVPWMHLQIEELPEELARATDSLAVGAFTKQIATSYGYFILRIARVSVINKIPFEKARDQLFNLVCSGKLHGARKNAEKDAQNFYNLHKTRFRTPDTLLLRAWLLPGASAAGYSGFYKEKIDSAIKKDTSWIKSRPVYSIALPKQVSGLIESWQDPVKKGSFLGPMVTPFGKWYFMVTDKKTGGKQQTFMQVKRNIISELASVPGALGDVPMTEREKFISRDMLAQAAWMNTMKNVPEPAEEEVTKALKDGSLVIPENLRTDDQQQTMLIARNLYKEKIWRSAQDQWKHTITIDYRLLLNW
jgi:hypothetical protein